MHDGALQAGLAYRALHRLKRDTLQAVLWDLGEVDALLLERMMRTSEPDSALEEAWFLCELRDRFRMPPEELARRFGRTPSWVSRRLALVEELPGEVQEHVLLGRLQVVADGMPYPAHSPPPARGHTATHPGRLAQAGQHQAEPGAEPEPTAEEILAELDREAEAEAED
jgi:hypothetical protein